MWSSVTTMRYNRFIFCQHVTSLALGVSIGLRTGISTGTPELIPSLFLVFLKKENFLNFCALCFAASRSIKFWNVFLGWIHITTLFEGCMREAFLSSSSLKYYFSKIPDSGKIQPSSTASLQYGHLSDFPKEVSLIFFVYRQDFNHNWV